MAKCNNEDCLLCKTRDQLVLQQELTDDRDSVLVIPVKLMERLALGEDKCQKYHVVYRPKVGRATIYTLKLQWSRVGYLSITQEDMRNRTFTSIFEAL